jgi:hypothetical protein
MATIEEARSAFKKVLAGYKPKRPTRTVYLGDGRGFAASNMIPPDEPDKFWARERTSSSRPFKVTNKKRSLQPAFNLPVILGYPDDQPNIEQILDIDWAGISTKESGASALGGTAPHHTQHEWGGGDEVFIEGYQFKPGLVRPTSPTSMRVKVLSFHHYYKDWRRFDGDTSADLSDYIPDEDYRYVLITLDRELNQLKYVVGNIFSPDISIDSIISNQGKTTFRHIPVPPANEVPLAAVLLQPDTDVIDWNANGINNLIPMRLLLGAGERDMLDRLDVLENHLGISTLPQTGAENNFSREFRPSVIDGQETYLLFRRGPESSLPTLLVGEPAWATDTSTLFIGTAEGNVDVSPTAETSGQILLSNSALKFKAQTPMINDWGEFLVTDYGEFVTL